MRAGFSYEAEATDLSAQLSGEVSEAILSLARALREDDREAVGQAALKLEAASIHAGHLAAMCRRISGEGA